MRSEEKKYPEPIVGALIINKEGKILLAKGKKWSGKFTIPDGHVEIGETLGEAVIRETKEETGLDVEIIAKLSFEESVKSIEHYKKGHLIFLNYLCKFQGDEKKVAMNEEFEKEFIWVSIEEAKKLDLSHGVRSLINDYELYLNSQRYLNSWKRCQADFENYKKDQAKGREEFAKFAKMDMILQILPVLDNFEISLAHVPEEKKGNGWVAGITHIKRQIEDILRNNNVEEIAVKIGDKFNPEIHEAVSGKGEKVKKVLQRGYKLNGKIVRVAKVEVE